MNFNPHNYYYQIFLLDFTQNKVTVKMVMMYEVCDMNGSESAKK